MPETLASLVEQGVIDEVLRPLQSGKEAQVFLVTSEGEHYVAKIYKEAQNRNFKNRSDYTEGRKVRNTRDQRAMKKGTNYGRAKQEAGWRDVEADVIYRLREVGVRVPEPRAYVDNVLVMELVTDRSGKPASRLSELTFQREEANDLYAGLISDVHKMLCAGLVHGDLSEFNILAGRKGAVIIDFPQAVEASNNRNARKLLIRDVGNLRRFFGRFSRDLHKLRHGEELWELYEKGELQPETVLTGVFKPKKEKVEVNSMLAEILQLEEENRARREALGLPPARPARKPVVYEPVPERTRSEKPKEEKPTEGEKRPRSRGRNRRRGKKPGPRSAAPPASSSGGAPNPGGASKSRRRRRRRKPGSGSGKPPT